MATITNYTAPTCATLAQFIAWAQPIGTALSAFGWSKSSDTGQVNWSTISSVPAYTSPAYEIWVSGDSLSSTNPIYMRIEYGVTTGTVPTLGINIGSSSNGSGVLNNAGGVLNAGRSNLMYPSASSTTLYQSVFAGGAGWFSLGMWRGSATPFSFTVERSHDASGNDTASYVTYTLQNANLPTPFCYQQSILPAGQGGPYTFEKYGMTFQTNNTTTVTVGNLVVAVPFYPVVGIIDNPMLGQVCLKSADVADGQLITASIYGTTHTYMVFKVASILWAGSATNVIALRYE